MSPLVRGHFFSFITAGSSFLSIALVDVNTARSVEFQSVVSGIRMGETNSTGDLAVGSQLRAWQEALGYLKKVMCEEVFP